MSTQSTTEAPVLEQLRENVRFLSKAVSKRLAKEAERDPFIRRELDVNFEAAMRAALDDSVPANQIVYTLASRAAKQRVVEFVAEAVRHNADCARVKQRREGLRALELEIHRVAELNEPVPAKRGRFEPFLLAYFRKQSPLAAQEAALLIMDMPRESLLKILDGKLPDFLSERVGEYGSPAWYAELALLFCEGDEDERQFARSVCTDHDLARRVAEDEDVPLVLQQLGKMVVACAQEVGRRVG